MTKPINTDSIAKATGKPWEQWMDEIEAAGGRTMTHTELARKLYDELDGTIDNHGWWAQGITVAYEQHIGKRVPGQLANGLFEITVSRTVAQPRDHYFPQVVSWFESQPDLRGEQYLKPRSSETPRRSTWRCDFADGSKFSATVEASGDKSKLILAHTALPDQQGADRWKEFWRSTVESLGDGQSLASRRVV